MCTLYVQFVSTLQTVGEEEIAQVRMGQGRHPYFSTVAYQVHNFHLDILC